MRNVAIPFILALSLSCVPKECEILGKIFIVTNGAESLKLGMVDVLFYPESVVEGFNKLRLEKGSEKLSHMNSELEKIEQDLKITEKTYQPIKKKYDALVKASERAKSKMNEANSLYSTRSTQLEYQIKYLESIESLLHIKKTYEKAKVEYDEIANKYMIAKSEIDRFPDAGYFFEEMPAEAYITTSDADGLFRALLPTNRKYGIFSHSTRTILDKVENYYWYVWVNVGEKNSQEVILNNRNMVTQVDGQVILTMKSQ